MIGCILTCTFVTLLLMVTTIHSSCLCAFRLPELQVFYDAMNGPQWTNQWDLSDLDAPCMFPGVTCAIDGVSDVTTINLSQQGLSGQLPAAIANLTKLTLFNVSFNSVTGTLPVEYAAWASISEFLVDSNNITGTLPPHYSAWGRMSRFYSGRNNISGTLPVSYSNWSMIQEFDVQHNKLSGSLPAEFANWMMISSFTLNNNLISSTLPPQYSQWGAALRDFVLQDCDIYGSLPASYSNWTSVSTFTLRNSRISGTLPPQYGAWVSIGTFIISYSSLSGAIPSTYNHWPYVTTIDLSNNLMTGSIPNNIWGNMGELNAVALWNNSLSGTIPPQLLQVPKLQYLSLGFNQLTGTIPPATSSLRFLIVQNNSELSGSIPASILLLSAFSLSFASICGTSIPCPNSTAPLYCFTHEMMYELYEQQVISAVIPYKAACPTSQPMTTTRTIVLDDKQSTSIFDTFIPAQTAPQTLVAIASIFDPISGVALVALGNSRCAPQSMRSSTSTSQVVLSPFYLLGPGASVFGNIGVVLVVVALHALLLRLYVAFGCQNWHWWRARINVRGNRTPTDRHRRSPPPPPSEITLTRLAAASVLRFPNLSIVIALHFTRGTVFYGAQGFVGTDDDDSARGDGSDSIALRAGSATASVLFLIGLVVCFVYAEVSGLTAPLVFQKYQIAVLRRWKWMPLWALPVGQWGPPEARHRLGPLRGSVVSGRQRFAMLTAASSLLIGAFPSSAAGCVAQAIGQCALLSAAAVVVAVMRPLRISLSCCLLCATWAVQGCLKPRVGQRRGRKCHFCLHHRPCCAGADHHNSPLRHYVLGAWRETKNCVSDDERSHSTQQRHGPNHNLACNDTFAAPSTRSEIRKSTSS